MKKLGIYIHIPFCLRKCYYCDFCSFADPVGERLAAYTAELCRRIASWRQSLADYEADTVYLGGGTPTLLSVSQTEQILRSLRDTLPLTEDCEITVECNPATADRDKLTALRAMGINRLSIGLQSANDEELQALGRAHGFSDFLQIFEDARAAGFDNISADVMFGIPLQRIDSYEHTLRTLMALSPEHISAYGLKIEEGTRFGRLRHTLVLPDEDTECEMYRMTARILSEQGYDRYEISNYAKSGRQSRHNLRYWRGEEYLGFGVAAHSDFGGERFAMSRDLNAFLRGESIECERERMSDAERRDEYLMLRLRLCEGVDLGDYAKRFGVRLEQKKAEVLRRFEDAGLLTIRQGRLALSEDGFLLSNTVLSELLDFA